MNRMQFGEGACEKIRRYMDSYISSELLVETNHEVLRHLEGCAACAAELEMRGRLRSRLKTAVQNQAAPPELAAMVRERIRSRQRSTWYRAGWTGWALATAAGLAISVGLWTNYRRPEALPDIVDRAAQAGYIQRVSAAVASVFKPGLADHIHCAVFRKYPLNPPSVETMEAALGAEYKGLLPLVEPLVPAGYRVVLAHQCTYAGRHFVHLTMRKDADVISVVVTKKEEAETLHLLSASNNAHGVPIYAVSTDRYQVAGFESARYLAFVVSGMSSRKNLEMAAALAPAMRRLLS